MTTWHPYTGTANKQWSQLGMAPCVPNCTKHSASEHVEASTAEEAAEIYYNRNNGSMTLGRTSSTHDWNDYKDLNTVNMDSMLAPDDAAAYRKDMIKNGNIRDVIAMDNSIKGYGSPENLIDAWTRREDKNITESEKQDLERTILKSVMKQPLDDASQDYLDARELIMQDAGPELIKKVNDDSRQHAFNELLNPPAPPLQPPAPPTKLSKREQTIKNVQATKTIEHITKADLTPTSEIPVIKPVRNVPMPPSIPPRNPNSEAAVRNEWINSRAKNVGIKHYGAYVKVFGKDAAEYMLQKAEERKMVTPPQMPSASPSIPARPVSSPALPKRHSTPLPPRPKTMAQTVIDNVRNDNIDGNELEKSQNRENREMLKKYGYHYDNKAKGYVSGNDTIPYMVTGRPATRGELLNHLYNVDSDYNKKEEERIQQNIKEIQEYSRKYNEEHGLSGRTIVPVSDDGTVLVQHAPKQKTSSTAQYVPVNTDVNERSKHVAYKPTTGNKPVLTIRKRKNYDNPRLPRFANDTFYELGIPWKNRYEVDGDKINQADLYNNWMRDSMHISVDAPKWVRPSLTDHILATTKWHTYEADAGGVTIRGIIHDSIARNKAKFKLSIAKRFFNA